MSISRPTGYAYIDTETTGVHPTLHEVWEVALVRDVIEVREILTPVSVADTMTVGAPAGGDLQPSDGWIITGKGEPKPPLRRHNGVLVTYERPATEEHVWQLRPRHLDTADPFALRLNGYWERNVFADDETREAWLTTAPNIRPSLTGRQASPRRTTRAEFARRLVELTAGQHLVGAIPSFDAQRLESILHEQHAVPRWHHHIIDVEALAIGYLRGLQKLWDARVASNEAVPAWLLEATDGISLDFDTDDLPWQSSDLTTALGVEPSDVHTALGDARWARDLHRRIMEFDN